MHQQKKIIKSTHPKNPNSDNVPDLRFPEFDENWEKKLFEEIYSFKATNSYSRDNLNYEIRNVKNIHYGDIHTKFNSLFDVSKELVPFINKEIDISKTTKESYLKEGDLVIADASEDYNDIGKTIEIINLNNEKVVAGLHTFLARRESDKLVTGFASFLMKTRNVRLEVMRIAQGTKVLSISTKRLAHISLLIPEPEEQLKIASFLTAVDKRIQLLQKKKAKLEEYKKGVMQKLFPAKAGQAPEIRFKDENGNDFPDWEEKKLGEVLLGNRIGGNYANSEEPTDKPLIKMGNIGRGTIKLDKIDFIKDGEQVNPNDRIAVGDLFFNTRNTLDLVGKVAIWRGEIDKAYFNSNLMWMKYENNEFMNYYFNSHNGLKALHRIATGTTSVAAIYTKDFLKIELQYPSASEQQKIAAFLSSLNESISSIEKEIAGTTTFKKGLLQKMFV